MRPTNTKVCILRCNRVGNKGSRLDCKATNRSVLFSRVGYQLPAVKSQAMILIFKMNLHTLDRKSILLTMDMRQS